MILETALADALHLHWPVPTSSLPPAPAGLRYDAAERAGGPVGFFSLVLFRQSGIHLRGASWLALSYPQVSARLCVRDRDNAPASLLLRQLAPGWVVPIARLIGGPPLSAAICDFPGGLPLEGEPPADADGQTQSGWRWRFSAGARFEVAAELAPAPAGDLAAGRSWDDEVAFFRQRSRTYWRRGAGLHRSETAQPSATVLPVRVALQRTDWLETFLDFAPAAGWGVAPSAFLVPRVQLTFAFDAVREMPAAAPMAAAG